MRKNISSDFRISLFETDSGRSRLARDVEGETISVTSSELDSLVLTTNLSRSNPDVESVVFSFAGTNIEFTDSDGKFNFRGSDGLDLEPGTHTLIVEGYARDGGRGRVLERREVEFTIEETPDFDPADNLPAPGGNDPFDPGNTAPTPDDNGPFDPGNTVPTPGGNGPFDPGGNLPSSRASQSGVQDDGVILGTVFEGASDSQVPSLSAVTPVSTSHVATDIEDLWFNQIDTASIDDLFSLI